MYVCMYVCMCVCVCVCVCGLGGAKDLEFASQQGKSTFVFKCLTAATAAKVIGYRCVGLIPNPFVFKCLTATSRE